MSISSDQRAGLIGLAAPDKPHSKTAQVRELLPEIDAAMARGVPQQTIVDQLADVGLTLTVDQLRNYLHRIRKPKRKPPDAKSPSAPAATPVPTRPAPASAGFDYKQHRDKPSDW